MQREGKGRGTNHRSAIRMPTEGHTHVATLSARTRWQGGWTTCVVCAWCVHGVCVCVCVCVLSGKGLRRGAGAALPGAQTRAGMHAWAPYRARLAFRIVAKADARSVRELDRARQFEFLHGGLQRARVAGCNTNPTTNRMSIDAATILAHCLPKAGMPRGPLRARPRRPLGTLAAELASGGPEGANI